MDNSNTYIYIYNSSDEKMSEAASGGVLVWKSALRNFAKFTEEHLCQSLYFNKVPGLCPATLLKRDFGTSVFLWILQNF